MIATVMAAFQATDAVLREPPVTRCRVRHCAGELPRPQHLLETSPPGDVAVGDVRRGDLERVASVGGEGSVAVAFVHQG